MEDPDALAPHDPPTIVLASGNPHKARELEELFHALGLGVRLMPLRDVARRDAPLEEPAETGSTFEENARIKAVAYAIRTGLPCLADDSGLEVDALGGRPGVISSHYCSDGREVGTPREARDRANIERVMHELEGVPPEQRGARFVCVMVLAVPDGKGGARAVATSRGAFEGRIGLTGDVPRGGHGFGYDPIFLAAPELALTSAELSPEEKNRRSHRARAAAELARVLRAGAIGLA